MKKKVATKKKATKKTKKGAVVKARETALLEVTNTTTMGDMKEAVIASNGGQFTLYALTQWAGSSIENEAIESWLKKNQDQRELDNRMLGYGSCIAHVKKEDLIKHDCVRGKVVRVRYPRPDMIGVETEYGTTREVIYAYKRIKFSVGQPIFIRKEADHHWSTKGLYDQRGNFKAFA
jgi:hypothetical protein